MIILRAPLAYRASMPMTHSIRNPQHGGGEITFGQSAEAEGKPSRLISWMPLSWQLKICEFRLGRVDKSMDTNHNKWTAVAVKCGRKIVLLLRENDFWSSTKTNIYDKSRVKYLRKIEHQEYGAYCDRGVLLNSKYKYLKTERARLQNLLSGGTKQAKQLLQTQIDLLTAKQDQYQPTIQNLERQYAEAQSPTQNAIGLERAKALREQLAKAQDDDRKHRQGILTEIVKLQEKQVRLELTENNEILLRMRAESKALIRASDEYRQSVGPAIDVNYETTRILLPDTSEAAMRVQERVDARLRDKSESLAVLPQSVVIPPKAITAAKAMTGE